jgi:hypothetical protein
MSRYVEVSNFSFPFLSRNVFNSLRRRLKPLKRRKETQMAASSEVVSPCRSTSTMQGDCGKFRTVLGDIWTISALCSYRLILIVDGKAYGVNIFFDVNNILSWIELANSGAGLHQKQLRKISNFLDVPLRSKQPVRSNIRHYRSPANANLTILASA